MAGQWDSTRKLYGNIREHSMIETVLVAHLWPSWAGGTTEKCIASFGEQLREDLASCQAGDRLIVQIMRF